MAGQIPIVLPFAAGILAFVSPCIIPMITVYLSLITGLTFQELTATGTEDRRRVASHIVGNTALFVAGFSVVFIAAGGAAGLVGRMLAAYSSRLNLVGGAFVIIFGLHLAGAFKLPLLERLNVGRSLKAPSKPLGPLGAFLVGLFFAVACSHCIGPMLYSMLLVAGTTGSPAKGMAMLGAFSAGLAIPYMLTALAVGRMLDYLARLKPRMPIIKAVSGGMLVALGLLMFTDKFALLSSYLARILPYRPPVGM